MKYPCSSSHILSCYSLHYLRRRSPFHRWLHLETNSSLAWRPVSFLFPTNHSFLFFPLPSRILCQHLCETVDRATGINSSYWFSLARNKFFHLLICWKYIYVLTVFYKRYPRGQWQHLLFCALKCRQSSCAFLTLQVYRVTDDWVHDTWCWRDQDTSDIIMNISLAIKLFCSDAQRCFREREIRKVRPNSIIFLGDSRMRDLFMQFDALVRLDTELPWNYGEYFKQDAISSFNNTKIVSTSCRWGFIKASIATRDHFIISSALRQTVT